MGKASVPVGRVGGLAVALGVGAAVLTGQCAPVVAWAQTGDGSADTSATGDSTSAEEPGTGADPTSEPSEPSSAESDATAVESAVTVGNGRGSDDDEPGADESEDEVADDAVGPVTESGREKRHSATPFADDPLPREAMPTDEVSPVAVTDPPVEDSVVAPEPTPEVAVPAALPPSAGSKALSVVSEPRPEPASADLLSTVLTAVLAPLVTGNPAAPVPAPAPVTLMALARREFDDTLLAAAPAIESVAAPLVAAVDEPRFTGQPSLIAQVFVAGLRLIKPVLNLFGIELNGTSARIPFFTDGVPPFFVTLGLTVTSSECQGWRVWTLAPPKPTDKVVVALHGGSFISTASLFHWWTYSDMARATGATVVVPLYPLANAQGTGGTAKTVIPTTADFIAATVEQHGANNVSVLGDSAGGSIALAAAQELVRRCNGDRECLAATLPGRMVLLSPALDASMTNPDIADVDDPLLSPASSKRNGQWWARGLESPADPDGTKHPLASPLYGSLADLPPTAVYAGSLDIRTPDVLVLQEKASATPGADFTFELRRGQIHDWTIFGFLPDAHAERPKIYRDLGLAAGRPL